MSKWDTPQLRMSARPPAHRNRRAYAYDNEDESSDGSASQYSDDESSDSSSEDDRKHSKTRAKLADAWTGDCAICREITKQTAAAKEKVAKYKKRGTSTPDMRVMKAAEHDMKKQGALIHKGRVHLAGLTEAERAALRAFIAAGKDCRVKPSPLLGALL